MLTKKGNKLFLEGTNYPEELRNVHTSSRVKNGWTFNLDYFCVNKISKLLGRKLESSDEVKEWYYEERERQILANKVQKNDIKDISLLNNIQGLNKELKDYQLQGVRFFLAVNRCMIAFDPGLGKAQPIDSIVLSDKGWTKLKDLQIGDKIYNSKGLLSEVLGIYPQGKIDTYEITFSDDSKTECSINHLWNVQNRNMRRRTPDKYKTMTLDEIMKKGIIKKEWDKKYKKYFKQKQWYIPLTKPIVFNEVDHIIHPYNLGLLIGDGCIKHGVVLCNSNKEIQDKFIKLANCKVNRVRDDLVSLYYLPYRLELQRLKLWGKLAGDKFIPKEYLFDSIDNRIQLLQGLMDTDGTIQGTNTSYSTKSFNLANDVKHLVQSLGGVSRVNSRIVNNETYYNVNVQLPSDIIPFSTNYHLNRYKPKLKYQPSRAIKDVKYIGKKEQLCIKTSAIDSLYLTNDFILTHNTLLAINCMKAIKAKKILVVCPSYLKYNWEDEIKKWSNDLTCSVINGTAAQREQGFKDYKFNNKNVLIINYEQIRYKVTKGENNKVTDREIKIHKDILESIWDLIVMDESHRLKGRDSQVSEGMLKLKSKSKIMLTGTPINKCETEIWKPLRILDKQRFTSYWKFAEYYCHVEDGFYCKEIKGLKNKKEYNKLLNRYMLRKKKEDVIDLPDKVVKIIKLDLTGKQLKIYKQAEKEYLNPKGEIIESDVEKFIRINQIVQNPAILEGENISCITDTAIEILHDKEEKFIIGCTFIKMSELTYEKIKKVFLKRKVVLVNGTIKIKERYEIIEDWKKSKNSIIITTIKAMSEGLNLDICDNMMYLDYDWSNSANLQFSNRIHRMTSNRIKFYYHLIVRNTCHEYKYYKLMNEDKRMAQAINDTPSNIKYISEEYIKHIKEVNNGK